MTVTDGRYRIAEVAARTGFSTPTLRYYEEIGLLPPADRSPAGYRVYDDRAVDRLRFVARAKQLGCTLEEIGELAEAWDRDECAPVKHRLRGVVAGKLDEVEARIAELESLRADLRRAAAFLESAPLDGPCDERCGCYADGVGSPTSIVPLTAKRRRRARSTTSTVGRRQP
jgi:DNA-binding transcriptional MerR regulator